MFGQVLRSTREAKGMTQDQLSYEAGVDRTYISHLENDHKSPTLTILFKISDALGVAPSSLVRAVESTPAFENAVWNQRSVKK